VTSDPANPSDPFAETLGGDAVTRKAIDPAAPPRPLGTLDPDRYAIAGEIARGGMGRILSARDTKLDRTVAIKELLAAQQGLAARFEREILLSARLQHPSIVSVHEAGRWPTGEPFYTMKLVEGRPLDKVVDEAKTLEKRVALVTNVIAIAEALAYAHAQRIIHRDLKPANVLVGAYGETVVIDWGLAKDLSKPDDEPAMLAAADRPLAAGSEQRPAAGATGGSSLGGAATVAGAILGTPAYMPPEQAEGRAVDERADVYAIGAILYHVLAGRAPYIGSSSEILAHVLSDPPAPLANVAPGLPRELVTITAKAMSRERAARYPTARELLDDLKRFETGQLVASHSYSSMDLIRRWVRRHQAAVLVGFVAVLGLAVLGTISARRLVDKQRVIDKEQRALSLHRQTLIDKEKTIARQGREIERKQAAIERLSKNQREQQRLIARLQKAQIESERRQIENELLRAQVEQLQMQQSMEDPAAPAPPPRGAAE
jgi:serine/threonine protein kinase